MPTQPIAPLHPAVDRGLQVCLERGVGQHTGDLVLFRVGGELVQPARGGFTERRAIAHRALGTQDGQHIGTRSFRRVPTACSAPDRSRKTRLLVAFWARAKPRRKTLWRSRPWEIMRLFHMLWSNWLCTDSESLR